MVDKFSTFSQRQGGFTLLELLVVLLIAALLVSIVPTALSSALPGARFRAEVGELAQSLKDARRTAIHSVRMVDVTLDIESGQYGTNVQTAMLPADTIIRASFGFDLQNESWFGGRDPMPMQLRFYPDGSSSGGTISLSRDSAHYLVTVDWLTGRVDVIRDRTHANL